MKKIFVVAFFLLLICTRPAMSQTVLLQVDRATDSLPLKRGPNLQKFVHFFLFAGLIAGPDEAGAQIKYGSSADLGMGVRWKYKISDFYSTGFEWRLDYFEDKLRQQDGKTLPDTLLNDVERMDFTSIQLAYYSRFNFDVNRGNYVGYYLDIGALGEWDYSIQHITKNDLPDGSRVVASASSLPYVNHFNYSLLARIGLNKFSIYALYRVSDLFKSQYNYPELPRLTLGLEFAVYRQ